MRARGYLQGVVAAAIAGLAYTFDYLAVAWVAGSIGTLAIVLATFSPAVAFAAVDRLVRALALRVGWALNWILLSSIFVAFFVPFGLLFRRGRRDAMRRFYEPEASSYWIDRDPSEEATRSRRHQY